MSISADLAVAGRLMLRALGRRLLFRIQSPPDLDAFQADLQTLLEKAPEGVVRNYAWLDIPATQAPWVSAGLTVQAGDQLSYFLEGRTYVSRFLDIYVNPDLQVWCKIGDSGEVFRGTRSSHSFASLATGAVQFGNYFPNDWADKQGARVQDDAVYADASGEVRILVIQWAEGAEAGLRSLLAAGGDNAQVRNELQRLEQGNTTPKGWRYLWHLGPAEIFRAGKGPAGEACVHCHTDSNVGILQKDVDLPLRADTEISWRWLVNELPSTLREDTLPSHDYLSIAVEFDNGRDITYYWSATLPEGYGYDCPLPNWAGKEYHVVVRSGKKQLGQWLDERRNLFDDYAHYMGEPPARITRVWFIANSIFQRKPGSCDYADIQFHGQGEALRVL